MPQLQQPAALRERIASRDGEARGKAIDRSEPRTILGAIERHRRSSAIWGAAVEREYALWGGCSGEFLIS